jgi:hypothetical protein
LMKLINCHEFMELEDYTTCVSIIVGWVGDVICPYTLSDSC